MNSPRYYASGANHPGENRPAAPGSSPPTSAVADDLNAAINLGVDPHGDGLPDYTDSIQEEVNEWLAVSRRKELAVWWGLDADSRRAFIADPRGWLQWDDRYQDPVIQADLEREWTRWTVGSIEDGKVADGKATNAIRKREAIIRHHRGE